MNSIIPLTGLQVASQRFANSANNVANNASTNFQAYDVQSSSVEPQGGVKASSRPREPIAELLSPQKDNALYTANEDVLQAAHNVSPEHEMAEQILSKHAYMSNLRSLNATLTMEQSLLDIVL